MVQIDLKPALLELLQEEEVKRQIQKIAEAGFHREHDEAAGSRQEELKAEIERLKAEKEMLSKELSEEKARLMAKEGEIERLKAEKETLGKELSEEKTRFMAKEEQLKKRVESVNGLLDLWERIQHIPEKYREYFNTLAGAGNMMAYFSIGRDMAKMKQMQQRIRDIAVEDTEEEAVIHALDEWLCLCVEVGNYAKNPGEKLEKIPIGIGGEFDWDICIKTSSSRNTGYVSKVLIQGFRSQEGKVIFPGVVRLS